MMLRVSSKITVFKLDSTGTLVWQRDYAAGVDAYFQSLALTSDGGAIVSGTVSKQTVTTYTSSVLLLKLDLTGKAQFARTILPSGNINDLNVVGVQQTADGIRVRWLLLPEHRLHRESMAR